MSENTDIILLAHLLFNVSGTVAFSLYVYNWYKTQKTERKKFQG